MEIKDLLDRFEILYPYKEKISLYRRAYTDKDLSSIFKILDSDELRKAVLEENLHSIFRLIKLDENIDFDLEDLRKAVIEENLHSIFRLIKLDENIDFDLEDLRKAVIEENLHSIFRLIKLGKNIDLDLEDLRKAVIEENLHSLFRIVGDEELRKVVTEKNLHSLFRIVGNDDLRKAVIEKNLHSIFRLSPNDDVRKLLLEESVSSLWKLLSIEVETQFIVALKYLIFNDIKFDYDCLSQGQIKSKIWLIDELKNMDLNLGTVFICAGWYATLATMMFENSLKITKIRSFDIDSSCVEIAERFNKPWVSQDWKFKSSTKNILDINYDVDMYQVKKSDGTLETCKDRPDTIINTSCEHIENFSEWYSKIPRGKLVILQTNDYFEIEDHVNCSSSLEEFALSTPMNTCLYSGSLTLPKYTRYMRIGYK